tara:strand:+ start:2157 stop:2813 length:657 start_codon:yes stop_codon:yes gene_type:complete
LTSRDPNITDINVILWDFGGVFTGSPFHGVDDYAAKLGITVEELTKLVLGYGLPNGDHPWHRLERGEVAMEEAALQCVKTVEDAGVNGFDLQDFFKAISGRSEHADEMYKGVRRFKSLGIRQVIVSNNFREFSGIWKTMLPKGLFDDIIDSSQVGVRKPDPAIFRLALETGGAPPSRTAFLDDYEEHVNVANSMGIQGILVGKDPTEALAKLEVMVNS